jgi:AAA+ ATPase superfamily predicted ATPase
MVRDAIKNSEKIIGRQHEQRILEQVFNSKKAEFLAIYGRRRIGKTYLIKNFFNKHRCTFFHMTGIQDGTLEEHLKKFAEQIGITFYDGAPLVNQENWLDSFEVLTKSMERIKPSERIVLFFDELPWMATKRSRLLQALEFYWNRYWSHDRRIKLIICGSSASWIIEKIINNKKGLYNRVTEKMRLTPFSLAETKDYLKYLEKPLNSRQVLALYMAIGGIPHYLEKIRRMKRGLSAQQYVNELCFQKDGALVDEFEPLFSSLFGKSEIYTRLIRMIAKHRSGVSQAEIMRKRGLSKGGRIVKRLKQLEETGFIFSFIPHGYQKRGIFYKIVDEYILFYLDWIEPNIGTIRHQGKNSSFWLSKVRSAAWKSWAGLAFEAVCCKHVEQIRQTLSIDPGSEVGSWRYIAEPQKDEVGAQIDLLFDSPDELITICEIKHSETPFSITKEYAQHLKRKIQVYENQTQTSKQISLAMITSSKLKETRHSKEIVSQEVSLEDLFKAY